MKKSIIFIALTALALSSCALDKPTRPGHTYDNMKEYALNRFSNHVVYPAGIVNMLIRLDEYLGATDEEKQSEAFQWHRENIFHEDDVTFMIRGLGTVRTFGKRLQDPGADWEVVNAPDCQKVDEFKWVITQEDNVKADICSIVTYEGKYGEGKHMFAVEVNTSEERPTSYHSDATVKATLTTPEGPMIIIDPQPTYHDYGYLSTIPEGQRVFLINTERNGQPLDWAELRYDKNGKDLIFRTNIE